MTRVFIIHRWSGGPNDDWRPWLKTELEQRGYQVYLLTMPDTETPTINNWVQHLASSVGTPDNQTYFIGHSIGCQTILRYLETINVPVGGALFVAGWFNLENLEDAETITTANPWITTPINLPKVKSVLKKSTAILSDNDPFDALAENKEKFSALSANILILPNAGHITADDGFIKAPIILQEFLKLTE